jgi:hypothetical protein
MATVGKNFELSCTFRDDNFNSLAWMFISRDVFCDSIDDNDIQTINMPIYTLGFDIERYDKKSARNQLGMTTETLRVKHAFLNQSGAYICITGHMNSVRFNIFYVAVVEEPSVLSKKLTTYHYVTFGLVLFALIVIILTTSFVLLKKILKLNHYCQGKTDIENGKFVDAKVDLLAGKNKVLKARTGTEALIPKTPDKKLVVLRENLIYSDAFTIENVVDNGRI